MRRWIDSRLLWGGAAFLVSVSMSAQVSVLMQHNDAARTGANLAETVLNVSNVNVTQFGKLFTRSVDGQMYAQPLVVSNVNIPGKGARNVVFVATMHNSVYAFDADDPAANSPYWSVNLGPSVPSQDTGTGDIQPEIGITATPAVDPSSNTIYVVAKTKESGSYLHRLHALDLSSGQEKAPGPVLISASVPGNGDGNNGGVISFNHLVQLNRSALLLLNGRLYVAFGSHGDKSPAHGWILGYDAATLQRTAVFNSTATGWLGTIWQAGQGMAADAAGYLYLITGNGAFNYSTGGQDLGQSFVKLSTPNLTVVDWFTPYNYANLNAVDFDLGASGPLLIPGTNLLVGGGKESVFYLLDRSQLGHFNAGGDTQIVQSFTAGAGHIHGSPVYWNGPGGPFIYLWSEQDRLKQFRFGSVFQTTPVATSDMTVPPGMPGGMLAISAAGNAPGSGILWAAHPLGDSNPATVPGILRAFDAADVGTELWNSLENAPRDDVGNFAKFCAPTIANGKVYMATFSNRLVVYGLSPTACPTITLAPSTLPSATAGTAYNQTVTPSGGAGPYQFNATTGLPPGITASPGTASVTLSGTAAAAFTGMVVVSGTDANGCPFRRSYPFSVTCPGVGALAVTSPATVRPLSTGNAASVPDAGPGATYAWTATGGTITSAANARNVTFSAPATGFVTLEVTVTGGTTGCGADGTVVVPTLTGDFDRDGKPDLLWRNTSSGLNSIRSMNGFVFGPVSGLPTVPGPDWEIAGSGDFDGNGTPDILWRNRTHGFNSIWLMNGLSVSSVVSLPTVADTNWRIQAVGDLDGDGKPDILWRSFSGGLNGVWLMNGTSLGSVVGIPAVPDTTWEAVGMADFDSDGEIDIVWRNRVSGLNGIWKMDGAALVAVQALPAVESPDWRIVAVGDYDQDGNPDFVWRNTATNFDAFWKMDGTAVTAVIPFTDVLDNTWVIAGPR